MSLQSNPGTLSQANGTLEVPKKTSKVAPANTSDHMELTEVKVAKDPTVSYLLSRCMSGWLILSDTNI